MIFLVGFMGSGKSSVGRELAARLRLPFIDLDEVIVKRENRPIREIFQTHGEVYFRRVETEELRRVCGAGKAVVALGGGAFCVDENRELVRGAGTSVWLDVPFEELYARCSGDESRPLFSTREEMLALLEKRKPLYALADIRIPAGGRRPTRVAGAVLSGVQRFRTDPPAAR
jgi:shikimate kinase